MDVGRLHSDAFFQDEIGAETFAGGDQRQTVVEPRLEVFEGEAKGFLVRLNRGDGRGGRGTRGEETNVGDEMKGLFAGEEDGQEGEEMVGSLVRSLPLLLVFGLPVEHRLVQRGILAQVQQQADLLVHIPRHEQRSKHTSRFSLDADDDLTRSVVVDVDGDVSIVRRSTRSADSWPDKRI